MTHKITQAFKVQDGTISASFLQYEMCNDGTDSSSVQFLGGTWVPDFQDAGLQGHSDAQAIL